MKVIRKVPDTLESPYRHLYINHVQRGVSMSKRYAGILLFLTIATLFNGCGGDSATNRKKSAKIAGSSTTATVKVMDFTMQIPAGVTVETLAPFRESPFQLYSSVNDPQFGVNPGKYNVAITGGVLKTPGVVFTPGTSAADTGKLRIVVEFPTGFGLGQAISFNCIAAETAAFNTTDFPIISSTLTDFNGSTITNLILEVAQF
jgi:hypothetical protein